MLKRKAADQEGGSGKKGVPSDDTKVQPIPRHLPEKSVTLHFLRRTWEEFAPGILYYLPTCINPRYMFNLQMENQFNKFKGLWETMEIHEPTCRLTNLIFLQDDLRVQSNTPTDATAFTQVCYLMHFTPAAQTEYFALAKVNDRKTMNLTTLTYTLQPPDDSQVVKIGETAYTNFEELIVRPAKINKYAGWDPEDKECNQKIEPHAIQKPYITPWNCNGFLSCNLQVPVNETYFLKPSKTIAYASDMDALHIYKYGDSIGLDIETNLNGVKLYRDEMNNFLKDGIWYEHYNDNDKTTYSTEWMYPGNNRPYKCRCTNFDPMIYCTLHNKGYKPLKHHFLTMPPIKKPNGALLGQRCSAIMEQTISVTFHFHESTFDEYESTEDSDLMAQNSAVILKRGVYGKTKAATPPPEPVVPGVLCPYGMDCSELCEYSNDWIGFNDFLCDSSRGTAAAILQVSETRPSGATSGNTLEMDFPFNGKHIATYFTDKTEYNKWINDFRVPNRTFYFHFTPVEGQIPKVTIEGKDYYLNLQLNARASDAYCGINQVWGDTRRPFNQVWVTFNINAFDEAVSIFSEITCKPKPEASAIQNADFVTSDLVSTVFFK